MHIAQRARPHLHVSSGTDGGKIPARLFGISLVRSADNSPISGKTMQSKLISKELEDCSILDSGSAITLAGDKEVKAWVNAGYARYVNPQPRSVRGIHGIGALNRVTKWIQITLDIGGALVTFHDVPVLREHRGFLIGNDFLGKGRAQVLYNDNLNGTLTLRDNEFQAISAPVAFRTGYEQPLAKVARQLMKRKRKKRKARAPVDAESEYETDDGATADSNHLAADFGELSEAERAKKADEQAIAKEVDEAIKSVVPVGWTPTTVEIPAWSEIRFPIRLPASLAKATEVMLLPLEDERREDIGVLIAPTIESVTKDGHAMCRAINMNKHKVRIPLLTPVVRFQVDPRIYGVEYEHTDQEIMEKINLSEDLTADERAQVLKLVGSRRALFQSHLGHAHGYKMKIKVRPGSKPPNATLRVRTTEEEEAMNKEVTKQWKAGLIEPCRSPYGALPMLVKKPTKEGEPQAWRMVLDYRGVNAILEKDVYPLPNLATNLSKLGKANWFTTCDLLQGFHQVEVEDDGSKEVTAFNTPMGQFQYVRMPMGLASSPSTFMRIVDATLRGLPPGIALAYVDDICIPTCGTFADHMRDVGLVFDRLIEAGFTVRCDKCHIGMREVPYLGFMVGAYGTRPLAEKTQAILDIAIKDIHNNPVAAARYAGMLGFYSRFIPDLQNLLHPFHELKRKTAPTAKILGDASTPPSCMLLASFAVSKHRLASITALARPDDSQPYYIHVDAASSCGIGAVLMQRDDPNDPDSLRPIEFWSRRLSDEERGYGVRDQECLGLAETLKQWRHYISGRPVHLMTDHASLQWLLTTPHKDDTRVAGWALTAQKYDLVVEWIPGKQNVVGDFFSRNAKHNEAAVESGAASKRLPIEERLEEAEAATVQVAAPTTFLEDDGSISLCFNAEAKEELDALSDAGTEDARAALYTDVRQARRAALVVVRSTPQNTTEVLVEKVADTFGFPSVAVDMHATNFDYRKQLAANFQHGELQALLPSLAKATAFKRRRQQSSCHYFIAAGRTGDNSEAVPGTEFIPLSELTTLSSEEDQRFARLIARELGTGDEGQGKVRNDWSGRFAVVRSKLAKLHSEEETVVAPIANTGPATTEGPVFCNTVPLKRAVKDTIACYRACRLLRVSKPLRVIYFVCTGHKSQRKKSLSLRFELI